MASTLPPLSQTATLLAGTIGLAATAMGLTVALHPSLGLQMWHFTIPPSTSPQTRSLILDTLRLFAIREFCIGASIAAAAWLGEGRVLGAMLCFGVPVVLVDGFVARRQTGRGEWVHWGLGVVFAGLGWAVLER